MTIRKPEPSARIISAIGQANYAAITAHLTSGSRAAAVDVAGARARATEFRGTVPCKSGSDRHSDQSLCLDFFRQRIGMA